MTLNPGHSVVQAISLLLEPSHSLFSPIKGAKLPRGSATVALRAILHDCQDDSECHYSPMILTSTRFRRRPSRLTCQPFRLASKDPLPRAKDFGEGFDRAQPRASVDPSRRPLVTATTTSRPITRNLASCVPFQVRSGGPVTSFRTRVCLGQAWPARLCNRPLGRRRR
mgnify:CR=1 FL=1